MASDVRYVDLPFIRKNSIEERAYQLTLSEIASRENTMIVLSTGLGKTVIAALAAARRLHACPTSKILFLAPSRPLAEQQARFLRRVIDIDENLVVCMTGNDPPEERRGIWEQSRMIVMTPQALQNDLIQRAYDLSDVSLIIYDEAHRGVGNYAYTFVADMYEAQGHDQRSVGLTASPGHDPEHIQTVCKNLRLSRIEMRNEQSPDVRPYMVSVQNDIRYVTLPPEIEALRDLLSNILRDYVAPAADYGIAVPDEKRLSRREVLRMLEDTRRLIGESTAPPKGLFMLIRQLTAALRVVHLLEFVGTQGLEPTSRYVESMYEEALNQRSSKGLRDLLGREEFKQFEKLLNALISKGLRHPKADALLEIVSEQISANADSRVLVFTRFRDTATEVVETLSQLENARVSRFVGQSSRGMDRGLSQKKQVEILDGFRRNEFNILVATQVGEEGLDIPECNLVVFYDCVPSVVPYIQRRGRTGRRAPGRVVILVSRGTHDEYYHWSVMRKLKQIPEALRKASQDPEKMQTSLEEFETSAEQANDASSTAVSRTTDHSISLIVDSRELPTGVARELTRMGVGISGEKLDVGDYIASEETAIERKTTSDFVQSIIDGRLFVQLSALRATYRRPVLLIEGEHIVGASGMNPAAIFGTLASVATRLQIPIIWTRNEEESAAVLYRIAHLEQVDAHRPLRTRQPPATHDEARTLEYILSGFPGVDTVISRSLLQEFGTLEKVFSATEKELQRARGVGPKTAATIRRILTLQYTG
ncbi:MAG: helicase-related protein [Candidatus Thorarchaeota archaeon]